MENFLKSSLLYVVITAWVCTIVDGIATTYWISQGMGYELNPIWSSLIAAMGIVWTMLIRVLVGLFLLWLLYLFAEHGYNLARYGFWGVTAFLAGVVLYHAYGAWLLLY